MTQIIQHTKSDLLDLFFKASVETLPSGFQVFLQSFPEVFTPEILSPYGDLLAMADYDDAIMPPQKKVFNSKPPYFQTQQYPMNQHLIPSPPTKTQSSDNYNSFNYKARALVRTPFSSSGFSTDLGERVWFYIDEQNEIQGPFTTLEMDSWFEKGFLFDELKICHSFTNKFFPLYDLFVVEKAVKSASNLPFEIEPVQTNESKVLKKIGSDIVGKEHFSNKNETQMFETLKNVLTQQSPIKPNLNDQSTSVMDRNIRQLNVVYPKVPMNNNEAPQSLKNVPVAPINPSFNPLYSSQQAINKQFTPKEIANSQINSNPKICSPNDEARNLPLNNHLLKKNPEVKKEMDNNQPMNKEAKPFYNGKYKETVEKNKNNEKHLENKDFKNDFDQQKHLEDVRKAAEETKKKTSKTEYVKVYEPKKSALEKEPIKEIKESHLIKEKQQEEVKMLDKDDFEIVNNSKLLKDLKHNKGSVDKERYFIVYQPKPENQPENKESKVSQGKEEAAEKEKMTGKTVDRKIKSSNSPEEIEISENKKEKGGRFNTQLFQKENKNNNKPNKQAFVKEYVLKK